MALADKLPAQLEELNLRPRTKSKHSYTIRRLSIKDKEPVIEFLRRFFFRDEPLNFTINLLDSPEGRCYELEEYAASTLEDGVSTAVVDENGEFVGVVINGVVSREEVDYTDKSEECPHPKFKRILKLLSHLDREARIWDKLPASCKKVMEVRIASTHTSWRGRGLMRVLCEESERIAREVGAGAMRMDTTSAFSAAAAERLNYKKVYGLFYSEIPYAPHPDPPHLEARVYLKEL
ncbi:arylalkylamine N-acetyltransferase 1-like isoform X2 [Leptidea sinapis]|uniref:arylalkylamine N-acetyltransferase 1-like isoform X2 n=1 Tax=Leptidea sinapis TaxID=189913 RepID=UPI0021C334C2|nr:arylalkylamine N-acetyltransferase 1-like isoform X2 [Leptidea sinapis]